MVKSFCASIYLRYKVSKCPCTFKHFFIFWPKELVPDAVCTSWTHTKIGDQYSIDTIVDE